MQAYLYTTGTWEAKDTYARIDPSHYASFIGGPWDHDEATIGHPLPPVPLLEYIQQQLDEGGFGGRAEVRGRPATWANIELSALGIDPD